MRGGVLRLDADTHFRFAREARGLGLQPIAAPAVAGAVPTGHPNPQRSRNRSHRHGILSQFRQFGIAEGRGALRLRLSSHHIARHVPKPFTRAK